ncbi:potassium channel family protein [Nitrosospira multiformis]|uniref:Ion channel n=1 Tax=Nitrosospira multiformis TaxID=1231 RepID=A0A1I7GVD4_9PROT|nr:potassium channel family protein [Nitrosospira multiformis]SFU52382.1 Ion channel [Nitrosospira multiformis]
MNEHAAHLIVLGISGMIVAICVMLHYEALRFLGLTLGAHVHKRIGVLLVMMGLLIAHFLEVWVFAVAYMFVEHEMGLGRIAGITTGYIFDYFYYSSISYTTVGFGDLIPVGAIRMLTAAEGLAGLLLITWSASFTFLAMQRFWPHALAASQEKPEGET